AHPRGQNRPRAVAHADAHPHAILPTLHDNGEPPRRAGDAGIEPARAAVGEREALVEQHHVVPLRALRLVHGEHVAVVELVVALAWLQVALLEPAGEALAPHRDLDDAADVLVRLEPQAQRIDPRGAARLDAPQAAVE